MERAVVMETLKLSCVNIFPSVMWFGKDKAKTTEPHGHHDLRTDRSVISNRLRLAS